MTPKFGVHRITGKNWETRMGVCSSCGPIGLTVDGCCAQRARNAAAHYNKENKEEKKIYMAAYLKENKERLQEYRRANWHLQQYGVSREVFFEMLAIQDGRCAICRTDSPGAKTWRLDHDHKFEKKDPEGHRGLLCHRCNVALGLFVDSIKNLQAAIHYLARRKESAE